MFLIQCSSALLIIIRSYLFPLFTLDSHPIFILKFFILYLDLLYFLFFIIIHHHYDQNNFLANFKDLSYQITVSLQYFNLKYFFQYLNRKLGFNCLHNSHLFNFLICNFNYHVLDHVLHYY